MFEGYVALVLGAGIAVYAAWGLGKFFVETFQMYRTGTAEVRRYRHVLRRNINQLAEAIAEEDPEEMTDPMLREALAASIAEYRSL